MGKPMIKKILALLLISSQAFAGLPPTTSKVSGDTADLTTFNYQFPNFTGTHTGTVISLGVNGIAGGGTGQATKSAAFDALSPMTTSGDIIYGGASGTGTRLAKGTNGQLLSLSAGVPAWANNGSVFAPTQQHLTTIGSATGYMFTVTSANATVGATYTNNGHTYTVLATISAGTQLFTSQASAPASSGTLTKSGGTGDATITFSSQVVLATYTTPSAPAPNYLHIKMVGGGGGGGGGGTTSSTSANAGTSTAFGANELIANGGGGGTAGNSSQAASAGGTYVVAGHTCINVNGSGGEGTPSNASGNQAGGTGGTSAFGGAGAAPGGAGGSGTGGNAAATNSGSGGSGGTAGSGNTGGGGGAGAFIDCVIPSPSGTYVYTIGTGGSGGSAGTGGSAGASGGSGQIMVEEYYQ